MKKLLSILLILLFSMTLIACDNDNKDPNPNDSDQNQVPTEPEKVELTSAESQTFIEGVDIEKIVSGNIENVSFLQTSNVEFDLAGAIQFKAPFDSQYANFSAIGKSSSKIHISSGQNTQDLLGLFEVNADAKVNFEINNPESLSMAMSSETKLNFGAYIKDAQLYLNADATLSVKQGLTQVILTPNLGKTLISDLDLNDYLTVSEPTPLPVQPEINFDELSDYANIKVYKQGDDHQVVLKINKEAFRALFVTLFVTQGANITQIDPEITRFINSFKTFEIEIKIDFKGADDELVSISVNYDIEMEYQVTVPVQDTEAEYSISAKIKGESVTNFKAGNVVLPDLSAYTSKTTAEFQGEIEDLLSQFVS